MKKMLPIIFASLLIIVCIALSVIFLTGPDFIKAGSDIISIVSNPDAVSFSRLIESSNSVLTAYVIKNATSGDNTVYTLQVEEMLKGNNITGLGYLHVKSNVSLNIGEKIIIFSNSDQKYNYKEPFLDAPFVLRMDEGGRLSQINGVGKTIITDIKNGHVDFIRHSLPK